MTQYEFPQQRDHRFQPGGAVVSERRMWLREQLADVGIEFRFLLIQGNSRGNIVPQMRPPVIVDTVGMRLTTVVSLLDDLQAMRPLPPSVAIVAPDAIGHQRLAVLSSAVYTVVTDALLPSLRSLISHTGLVGRQRYNTVLPICLGFTPPAIARGMDRTVLPLLAVLNTSRTFDEAAATMTMSTRTLHRKLATLRAQLGLPPATSTRFRPQEVVEALMGAIANTPPDCVDASRTAA